MNVEDIPYHAAKHLIEELETEKELQSDRYLLIYGAGHSHLNFITYLRDVLDFHFIKYGKILPIDELKNKILEEMEIGSIQTILLNRFYDIVNATSR